MVPLKRIGEPEVLALNGGAWRERFLKRRTEDAKARPQNSQYAHPSIVDALWQMSHGKCFYCESPESRDRMTVDHYVEVAERPEEAFAWSNLYLACGRCQYKLTNRDVPVADCVDPCNPREPPEAHMAYDAETVRMRTPMGEQTIRKYKLNAGTLLSERRRLLREFADEVLPMVRDKALSDLSPHERERLRSFGLPDAPYSAMMKVYVDRWLEAARPAEPNAPHEVSPTRAVVSLPRSR